MQDISVPRRLGLTFILWLAGLTAAAQFAKMSIFLPEMAALYPNQGAEIGLLVSLIGTMGIVLGLIAGLLVTRFGKRRLLLLALFGGAVLSFFQSSLPGFYPMLASRVLESAAHLIIVVAAPIWIVQIAGPQTRGFAMTIWSTFFGVAFALIAWIGIPLVAAYGIESLFFGHGIAMLLTGLAVMIFLPEIVDGDIKQKLSLGSIWSDHIKAYGSAYISAPAFGWLFYTTTFVALLTVIPLMVPPEQRAIYTGFMPLVSIASSLIVGAFFIRSASSITFLIISFLGAALMMPLFLIGHDLFWPSIILFALLGIIQGTSFAAIPEINQATDDQALANGAMAQMGNLGNTLGTPLLLILLSAFETKGVIAALAICYFLGAISHLIQRNRRKIGA